MRDTVWLVAVLLAAGCGSSDDFSGVLVSPLDGDSNAVGRGLGLRSQGGGVSTADVSLITWPERTPTGARIVVDDDPTATSGLALHVDPGFTFEPRWYALVVKHHGIMGGANGTLSDGSYYTRVFGTSAPRVRGVTKRVGYNGLPWLDVTFSEDLAEMPAGTLDAAIVVRQSGVDRGCHLPPGTGPGTTLTPSREVPLSCVSWQDDDALTIEFIAPIPAAGGGTIAVGSQSVALRGHTAGTTESWYTTSTP